MEYKTECDLKEIEKWNMNESVLVGYGFDKGDVNNINKHELLPIQNDNKYYGNILLVKTNIENQIEHLTSEEYETFYNKFYGYFGYSSDDETSESEIECLDDLEEQSSSSDISYYDNVIEEEPLSDVESDIY